MENPSVSINWLRSTGPAIIVAAVVCGPGSILMCSKVGAQFEYQALWVLGIAAVLMFATTVLAGRVGMVYKGTPCDELASRLGRWSSVVVGSVLFVLIACFQSSNNVALVWGLEPMLGEVNADGSAAAIPKSMQLAVVLITNGICVAALYGFRHLYGKLERLMKVFVVLIVAAFLINFFQVMPPVGKALAGLIPSLPEDALGHLMPTKEGGQGPLWPLTGMIGTTFSVAAAFYRSYLVREKHWSIADAKRGVIDSAVGVFALCGISAIIMMTAAAAFYGTPGADKLNSVGEVARQLEPTFGASAKILFSIGILAGALSSFLVNALIGGTIFSDGLGLGSSIDGKWPKLFTVLALAVGAFVAILSIQFDVDRGTVITIAQALTVLGVPALALALLYLGSRSELIGESRTPRWIMAVVGIGFLLSCFLAARTALALYYK
ncbi:MAG: divalent metal cation transporter [Verrucomicrobiales bacterium]